ncbi:MAG: dCMP deaminase family protein [Candidatus Komeilibacteria bacterium]|nr:dCMP deaminase family protein [Candidatus Komeilibacteria bacterium]
MDPKNPLNITSLNNPKQNRLSWDELFMNIAFMASKRAADKYVECGAVYVDDERKIISIGYNGPSKGDDHCIEVGCRKVDGDKATGKVMRNRGAHAEVNGIINAQDTRRLNGATIYTTLFPCYDCMKYLNNAGIKEIVYMHEYARIKDNGQGVEREEEAWELAQKRNITIRQYQSKIYYDQAGFKCPDVLPKLT